MQSTRSLLLALACLLPTAAWAAQGKLTISLVDAQTNAPVAARMHLQTARGKAVKLPRTPSWKDHFPLDKTKTFRLQPGGYEFQIERGPEYRVVIGHFEIRGDAEDTKVVTLHRFVDMATQGWWSGDLHVHRPPRDVPLLLRANDLHIAPVISWWNAQGRYHTLPPLSKPVIQLAENRFYSTRAGEDERVRHQRPGRPGGNRLQALVPRSGSGRERAVSALERVAPGRRPGNRGPRGSDRVPAPEPDPLARGARPRRTDPPRCGREVEPQRIGVPRRSHLKSTHVSAQPRGASSGGSRRPRR